MRKEAVQCNVCSEEAFTVALYLRNLNTACKHLRAVRRSQLAPPSLARIGVFGRQLHLYPLRH